MSTQNTKYKTTSGFSEFVAFIGWSTILATIIGVVIIFDKLGSMGMMAIPICIAVCLVGLLLVVAGQSLSAQIDTANATQQMLKLQQEKD